MDFDDLDQAETSLDKPAPLPIALRGPPPPLQLEPRRSVAPPGAQRVLVVGAGPTGCLAASLLRRLADAAGKPLHLTVWERSRGPGGRMAGFWPNETRPVVADVGAQVLSLDPGDAAASAEAERLQRRGLVEPVPPGQLAETPERPVKRLRHWWALRGTSAVLQDYLNEAAPEDLRFNFESKRIEICSGGQGQGAQWAVGGCKSRPWPSNTGMGGGGWSYGKMMADNAPRPVVTSEFDAVLVAVNGLEALRIDGLRESLTPSTRAELSDGGIDYDTRLAFSFYFSPSLRPRLTECFAGVAEVSFEEGEQQMPQGMHECVALVTSGMPVHLVAWQDVKRHPPPAAGSPTVLTVHCARAFSAALVQLCQHQSGSQDPCGMGFASVTNWLEGWLGMQPGSLERHVLHVKRMCWVECQTVRALASAGAKRRECLAERQNPALVLCGDYLTEATFSGCLRSARAGAEAVLAALGAACEPQKGASAGGGGGGRAGRKQR